ncbi:PITH domain-containing protein [Lentinula aciculospora]|uniref:PITH domain-containing protein n=1 Tax=Lentinula aciculospora TaxID=153920 RepID=A0A9W8ZZ23_9AGAR|nr:PITH domain-containing protein [Lentinula aciculospora]
MENLIKTLAGSSTSAKDQGDVSLLQFLDLQQLDCLNESAEHNLKSIVSSKKINTSDSFLESDADEQLLLNIAFNQSVRVKSIIIKSTNIARAPKKIKLAVNRPSLGFDDIIDAEEPAVAQVLELDQETVKEGHPISLRFVRFQSVNSLHILIVSNHGDEDETKINAIDIIGVPVETTKDLIGLTQQQEK